MVQHQGIDVYVAPHAAINKRYPEHAVPVTSPAYTGDPNEVYIEAVDDERFVVVMDLMDSFDPGDTEAVQITYLIDHDDELHNGECTNRTLSTLKASRPRGYDLKGRYIYQDTHRHVGEEWFKCGFTFASLQMDEEIDMTPDEVARLADMHGKLVIMVQRGKFSKATKFEPIMPCKKSEIIHLPDTKISSKMVVKDNRVSHAVKHKILGKGTPLVNAEDGGIIQRGGRRTWECIGEPLEFTIRYRSRDALQKLEIIPKDKEYIDLTGTPPTSPRVKREPGVEREDVKEKVKIKREPNENNSSTDKGPVLAAHESSKPASDERNKKRKAMEDELQAVELEQKRMRLKKALADMENEE